MTNQKTFEKRSLVNSKLVREGREPLIVDDENQVVVVPISSETPVYRNILGYEFYEVLDHSGEVDLTRMNDGGPVLNTHEGEQIGVVEKSWLQDKKVYSQIRFSKNNPKAVQIFKDIKDKVIRNVSIDYSYSVEPIETGTKDNLPVLTIKRFEILGVSIVPIPADNAVGFGRKGGLKSLEAGTLEALGDGTPQKEAGCLAVEPKQEETKLNKRKVLQMENVQEILNAEQKRRDAIDTLVNGFKGIEGVSEFGEKAKRNLTSEEEFSKDLMKFVAKSGSFSTSKVEETEIKKANTWLPEKEARSFSISKVIKSIGEGTKLDGIEKEITDEMNRKYGSPRKGSFHVPMEVLMMKRANDTSTGAKGGYLIENQNLGFIDLLRNKTFVQKLGATVLTGLQADLVLPKLSSGTTVSWLGENALQSDSEIVLGQTISRPKFARGLSYVSRALVTQSNPSADNLVMTDLVSNTAIAVDHACLHGAGGDEPLGIANVTGIGSVDTSSATFAKMLSFESTVATANGDVGNFSFLTTPAIRADLKATSKDTGSGQYVWQNGQIDGYNAYATNQVDSSNIFFGNWAELIVAYWGSGIEVEVLKTERYSKYGFYDVISYSMVDSILRQPACFAVSKNYS